MDNIISTIVSRRSIRAYKNEQLKDDEINVILEAGKFAPTSMNQQPWHFSVVQNKELLHKINEGARNIIRNHPNKDFAKIAEAENFNVFYSAPTLVVVSGDTKAISPGTDCALALHNMLLAAESQNIGSCWVNAISVFLNTEEGQALKNELHIPEGYKAYCSGVFGYKAMEVTQTPPRKEDVVSFIK